MTTPTLLLQPTGSRNAAGAVTPTVTNATTTAGVYGTTWLLGTNGSIATPINGAFNGNAGTAIVRYRRTSGSYGAIFQADGLDNTARLFLGVDNSAQNLDHYIGTYTNQWGTPPLTPGADVVVAMTWGAGSVTSMINGVNTSIVNAPYTYSPAMSGTLTLGSPTMGANGRIEQALFFDSRIPDAEILALSTQPSAWAWPSASLPSTFAVTAYDIGVPPWEDE